MPEIEDHILPGDQNARQFTVHTDDEPGSGGAHHRYMLTHGDSATVLRFQNGAVNDVGPNGVTDAQLLAILIHRLQCFQKGPFASRENAITLTHLEDAMNWQNRRTIGRLRKGIEGTSIK